MCVACRVLAVKVRTVGTKECILSEQCLWKQRESSVRLVAYCLGEKGCKVENYSLNTGKRRRFWTLSKLEYNG